jgi:hypothetical protein
MDEKDNLIKLINFDNEEKLQLNNKYNTLK